MNSVSGNDGEHRLQSASSVPSPAAKQHVPASSRSIESLAPSSEANVRASLSSPPTRNFSFSFLLSLPPKALLKAILFCVIPSAWGLFSSIKKTYDGQKMANQDKMEKQAKSELNDNLRAFIHTRQVEKIQGQDPNVARDLGYTLPLRPAPSPDSPASLGSKEPVSTPLANNPAEPLYVPPEDEDFESLADNFVPAEGSFEPLGNETGEPVFVPFEPVPVFVPLEPVPVFVPLESEQPRPTHLAPPASTHPSRIEDSQTERPERVYPKAFGQNPGVGPIVLNTCAAIVAGLNKD